MRAGFFTLNAVTLMMGLEAHASELRYETPYKLQPEPAPASLVEPPAPLDIAMSPFYEEMRQDGVVTIYYGMGKDHFWDGAFESFFNLLQEVAEKEGVAITDWSLVGREISFTVPESGLRYLIHLGKERNEFSAALASYEIVFYGGHSRYGRGPAFEGYQNYFRLGYGFPVVEVDGRNPYFTAEPILDTDMFPIQQADAEGMSFAYQYRGTEDHSSSLPEDAYTKRIEGGAKDWLAAELAPTRQILVLKSCSNVHYWREPIRDRFPDPTEKLVFGTNISTYGHFAPFAYFIMGTVTSKASSIELLGEMNKPNECGPTCYTVY